MFLNPLALFFSLLAGVIVIMYLLKLRRKKFEVSSTLLWSRSVEDLIANAPFQKLRHNILMWLQILALILLALALARPTLWLSASAGISRIVLFDNTASMNATDGDPALGGANATRLEEARARVRAIIGNMQRGDRMMIVTFGGGARVVQPFASEAGLLRDALGRITPTDAGDHLPDALRLAEGVIKTNPGAVLTVVSDGGVEPIGNLIGKDQPVEYIAVGSAADNRAIVGFDVRDAFGKRGQLQVFAQVRNFGSQTAPVTLRCLVNDTLVQSRQENVPPGEETSFVFDGLQTQGRSALRLEIEEPDLLAADNVVEGVLESDSTIRVLLVTQGNFFLERMLALLPDAQVEKIAPSAYTPAMSDGIVVFDQTSPPALGPGRYIFLDAVPPLPGFISAPEPFKQQYVLDWNRLHPATRFVRFDQLAMNEMQNVATPDWTTTLAETAAGPALVAGDFQGVRLVAAFFDIYATDWPMQVGFPIFMSNTIEWLASTTGSGVSQSVFKTGETITLPSAVPLKITAPHGEQFDLQPDDSGMAYFNQTLRAGLYTVAESSTTQTQTIAVNLLSPRESDLTPQPALQTAEKLVASTDVRKENREIWPWMALAGLALLALEWQLYCRRAWL